MIRKLYACNASLKFTDKNDFASEIVKIRWTKLAIFA